MKILPVGADLFHADGQRDQRDQANRVSQLSKHATHKNCGTHRTSTYTDVPSQTFLPTNTPPSFINHRMLGSKIKICIFSL
jgi:hypothetical protein